MATKKKTAKTTKKRRRLRPRFRITRGKPLSLKKDTFEPADGYALVKSERENGRYWGPFIAKVIERSHGFKYIQGSQLVVREGDYIQVEGEDHYIIEIKDVLGCID